jgi:hypothetical protein
MEKHNKSMDWLGGDDIHSFIRDLSSASISENDTERAVTDYINLRTNTIMEAMGTTYDTHYDSILTEIRNDLSALSFIPDMKEAYCTKDLFYRKLYVERRRYMYHEFVKGITVSFMIRRYRRNKDYIEFYKFKQNNQ